MTVARRLALCAASAVVAAVLWFGGLIALAQYTEDLCFDDAEMLGYGAYTQSLQAWPPSLQCELRGRSDQPTVIVDHPFLGAAISGWRHVAPPTAAIVLALVAFSTLKLRADRTSAGR